MNLDAPPRNTEFHETQEWLEDLYEFLKFQAVHLFKLVPRSAAPTSEEGLLYYDSDDNAVMVYDGTAWRYLLANDDIVGTANEIAVTDNADGTVTIGLVDPLIVSKGGTGVATLTDGGILLGSGTGAITPLAQATNGQIPIGATGSDPTLATITAGSGIAVTNGSGSITVATDGMPNTNHTVPTSVTLNNGTSSDSVTDMQTFADGNTYAIAEVTGVPGIDLRVNFTGITEITGFSQKSYYVGSSTHYVEVALYNYTNTSWDVFNTVENSNGMNYRFVDLPGSDSDYISSGNSVIRYYHPVTGNASHDFYIDYVAIVS